MKRTLIITALILNALLAFSQVTYQYDNLNRLSQVTYSNGTTIDYTYDELGNRLTKTVSGATVYQVSLSANDASRGTLSGAGAYIPNSAATLEAIPDSTYRFVGWSDGNMDNPRTLTVTQDTTFTALFGMEDMFYVYAAPNNPDMGSVTGSDDYAKSGTNSTIFQAEYAANSIAVLTAIANAGFCFIRWNDDITDNPRSFTVTEDAIFTAIFNEETAIPAPEASAITLYPNPATEHITIILPDNVPQALFTLYDMQGKVLIRKEIGNQAEISIAHLAAAVYIYNIVSGTASYNGKLRIEN